MPAASRAAAARSLSQLSSSEVPSALSKVLRRLPNAALTIVKNSARERSLSVFPAR